MSTTHQEPVPVDAGLPGHHGPCGRCRRVGRLSPLTIVGPIEELDQPEDPYIQSAVRDAVEIGHTVLFVLSIGTCGACLARKRKLSSYVPRFVRRVQSGRGFHGGVELFLAAGDAFTYTAPRPGRERWSYPWHVDDLRWARRRPARSYRLRPFGSFEAGIGNALELYLNTDRGGVVSQKPDTRGRNHFALVQYPPENKYPQTLEFVPAGLRSELHHLLRTFGIDPRRAAVEEAALAEIATANPSDPPALIVDRTIQRLIVLEDGQREHAGASAHIRRPHQRRLRDGRITLVRGTRVRGHSGGSGRPLVPDDVRKLFSTNQRRSDRRVTEEAIHA